MILTRFILLFLALGLAVFPQSGRRNPQASESPGVEGGSAIADLSIEQMYTQAVNYARDKITELDEKKVPYSETLHRQILLEQKQLAAKYAAEAASREKIEGLDLYYLGRLHWLATNSDDAVRAFEKFLMLPSAEYDDMKQTARSVVVVMSAERGDLEKAEGAFSDYLSNRPVRTSEVAKMGKQMALAYSETGNYGQASVHALRAFDATTELLFEETSRARALSQFLDAGITAFQIDKELGRRGSAEAVLSKMQKYAATVQSHAVYFRAIDERIKYLIETGRKTEALAFYTRSLVSAQEDFPDLSLRAAVERNLKKREPHYRILGDQAPELRDVDAWIPGNASPLSELKGQVVLLDFWATWCGPCFEAFPDLIRWHRDLGAKGLVILGVTRYYGEAEGKQVNRKQELAFLKEFREKQGLPYGFAVADGQANQAVYGAMSIPTTVIIDRKGIVRYVETGAGGSREKDVKEMIDRLLAED